MALDRRQPHGIVYVVYHAQCVLYCVLCRAGGCLTFQRLKITTKAGLQVTTSKHSFYPRRCNRLHTLLLPLLTDAMTNREGESFKHNSKVRDITVACLAATHTPVRVVVGPPCPATLFSVRSWSPVASDTEHVSSDPFPLTLQVMTGSVRLEDSPPVLEVEEFVVTESAWLRVGLHYAGTNPEQKHDVMQLGFLSAVTKTVAAEHMVSGELKNKLQETL